MNYLCNVIRSVSLPVQSVGTSFLKCHVPLITQVCFKATLTKIRKLSLLAEQGIYPKKRKRPSPLGNAPFLKGIILKCVIKKPKKPNSANRKCVVVKLSNGKETTAYVPGIGHNLQEHQVVLCKNKRLKDVPGVKITCVRGKYDLPHVVKQVRK